eukprot:TRINITY_DN255_c0_g1_i1.p1 TRINITY_DN255_c0_g1~~TRINITY_DN255_c0_g1_i1.p1  ORF type:complete len:195 (+),score=21.08 TRINITY_DN255_c0_g1_i1:238-822(+)
MASMKPSSALLVSLVAVLILSLSAKQTFADSLPVASQIESSAVETTKSIEEAFTADLQLYLASVNYTALGDAGLEGSAKSFHGRGRMLKLTPQQRACVASVNEAGKIAGYPYLIPRGGSCRNIPTSKVFFCSSLMFQLLNANKVCYAKRTYPGAYNCAPKSNFAAIVQANARKSTEYAALYKLIIKYKAQLFKC